jgi:hypothetical protein
MITAERLREMLHYDPETGVFTYRMPRKRIRVGNVAGYQRPDGYRRIKLDKQFDYAHRLAWLYMTGEWPTFDIDHANGKPADNRWANLRQATTTQNLANSRKPASNRSGFKGACWDASKRKWLASIKVNGRNKFLGRFDCPAEAHRADVEAAEKLHGEFAIAE